MSGEGCREGAQKSDGRKLRIVLAKTGRGRNEGDIREIASLLSCAGLEVIDIGCRQTPDQIVAAAIEQNADLIGLSIFSRKRSYFSCLMSKFQEHGDGDSMECIQGFFLLADIPGIMVGVKEIFAPGSRVQDIADWVASRLAGGAERHSLRDSMRNSLQYA